MINSALGLVLAGGFYYDLSWFTKVICIIMINNIKQVKHRCWNIEPLAARLSSKWFLQHQSFPWVKGAQFFLHVILFSLSSSGTLPFPLFAFPLYYSSIEVFQFSASIAHAKLWSSGHSSEPGLWVWGLPVQWTVSILHLFLPNYLSSW